MAKFQMYLMFWTLLDHIDFKYVAYHVDPSVIGRLVLQLKRNKAPGVVLAQI